MGIGSTSPISPCSFAFQVLGAWGRYTAKLRTAGGIALDSFDCDVSNSSTTALVHVQPCFSFDNVFAVLRIDKPSPPPRETINSVRSLSLSHRNSGVWNIGLTSNTTTTSTMNALVATVQDLLSNSKHTRWIAPLILLGEAVLCGLIIWKVPCTYSALLAVVVLPPFPLQTTQSE